MNAPLLPDLQYTPNFAPCPSALFEQARRELAWDTRLRLRHTASTGLAYNYSGITYPDRPMPEFLRAVADAISATVAHPITNCLANLYDGDESQMGFHSDSADGIVPQTSTSILSLGGERKLTFRSKDTERRRVTVPLEHGSLLVMRASVQELWKHALLPEPGVAPRISLTFRHIARFP